MGSILILILQVCFGCYDPSKATGDVTWLPVTSRTYWALSLQGLSATEASPMVPATPYTVSSLSPHLISGAVLKSHTFLRPLTPVPPTCTHLKTPSQSSTPKSQDRRPRPTTVKGTTSTPATLSSPSASPSKAALRGSLLTRRTSISDCSTRRGRLALVVSLGCRLVCLLIWLSWGMNS